MEVVISKCQLECHPTVQCKNPSIIQVYMFWQPAHYHAVIFKNRDPMGFEDIVAPRNEEEMIQYLMKSRSRKQ